MPSWCDLFGMFGTVFVGVNGDYPAGNFDDDDDDDDDGDDDHIFSPWTGLET